MGGKGHPRVGPAGGNHRGCCSAGPGNAGPRGGTVLRSGDSLVLGAGSYREDGRIELQEITLQPQNPWVGSPIRDLDISRQTLIVMVRRRGQTLIPNGGLVLLAGDQVLLYKQHHKTENTPL